MTFQLRHTTARFILHAFGLSQHVDGCNLGINAMILPHIPSGNTAKTPSDPLWCALHRQFHRQPAAALVILGSTPIIWSIETIAVSLHWIYSVVVMVAANDRLLRMLRILCGVGRKTMMLLLAPITTTTTTTAPNGVTTQFRESRSTSTYQRSIPTRQKSQWAEVSCCCCCCCCCSTN